MEAPWIALLITVLVGPGAIKILEYFLGRGKAKSSEEKDMRAELRSEIESLKKEALILKEEIRSLDKELDAWKEKYFLLMEEYLAVKKNINPGVPHAYNKD